MCGIIGLHLKNHNLEPRLGELLTVMLEAMTTRGPDSAGIAVYSDGGPGPGEPALQYSLRCAEPVGWDQLAQGIAAELARDVTAEPARRPAIASAAKTARPARTSSTVTVRRLAGD